MFDDDPADLTETEAAIMEATYRALADHGYADVTIDDIGAEFEKSRSLLYYHYEDKEALLTDFLETLLARFVADVHPDGPDPVADLWALLDRLFPVPMDADERQFRRAIVDLRAHAIHDETHRALFVRADDVVHGALADCLERGVAAGAVRPVDTDRAARTVRLMLAGALGQCALTDDEADVAAVRACIDAYVRSLLRAPDD